MTILFPLAQAPTPPQIRDIVPPIDLLPYPPWVIYTAVGVTLLIISLIIWLVVRLWRNRPVPPAPTPSEIALAALEKARGQIHTDEPYTFSILVSDILRRYVSSQFSLQATQQTSPEFLVSIADFANFTDHEKTQLADFLDKCDLIKFARVATGSDESLRLLEQAVRFVEGGAR